MKFIFSICFSQLFEINISVNCQGIFLVFAKQRFFVVCYCNYHGFFCKILVRVLEAMSVNCHGIFCQTFILYCNSCELSRNFLRSPKTLNCLNSVNERILHMQHSATHTKFKLLIYKAGFFLPSSSSTFTFSSSTCFRSILLGVGQDEGQAEQQQADVEDSHAGGAC